MRWHLIIALVVAVGSVAASPTGFEYIGGIENTTHVWNEGSPKSDWYFGGKAAFQLSNVVGEQWEYVLYGVSYGDTVQDVLDNYVEISGADSANRVDKTDNLTYVNITAWKDLTIQGKSVRLAKHNHIGVNDDYMEQWFYVKAFDNIPVNVWFVIHRTDIDIGADGDDSFLSVKYLNGSEVYVNLSASDLIVFDGSEVENYNFLVDGDSPDNIVFQHGHPGDWKLVVHNGEVYHIFSVGSMAAGQEKQMVTWWQDSNFCSCTPDFDYVSVHQSISGLEPGTYFGLHASYSFPVKYEANTGDCTADTFVWQYRNGSQDTTWGMIPANNAWSISCSGVLCKENSRTTPAEGVYYYRTIVGDRVDKYAVRARWWCGATSTFGAYHYPEVYVNSSIDQISIKNATDFCESGGFLVGMNYTSNNSFGFNNATYRLFVNDKLNFTANYSHGLRLRFNNTNMSVDYELPGFATGDEYSDGYTGGGLLLNGSDYLNYSVAGNLNFSNGTISFWLQPITDAFNDEEVLYYRYDNNNYFNFSLRRIGTLLTQVLLWYNGGGTQKLASYNYINAKEWSHHAVTFEEGGSMDYYLNGQLESTATNLPAMQMDRTGFNIGSPGNAKDTFLNFSQFKIDSFAMSAEEVGYRYALNATMSDSDLYFNLSDRLVNDGDTVIVEGQVFDKSGHFSQG